MKKRVMSILLALCLVVGLMPVTAGAVESWYEAYQRFIVDGGFLNSEQNYDVYSDNGKPTFALYDLNQDGIPEIIAFNGSESRGGAAVYAYAYLNGSVAYKGVCDEMGYFEYSYAPYSGYPGLFVTSGGGQGTWVTYIRMKNSALDLQHVVSTHYGEVIEQTSDKKLYAAYCSKQETLRLYSVSEIRSMGWDAFAAKYGFSKPAPVHTHSLKQVPAVAATCTQNGNIAYWMCSGCGKYFADASGKKETSLSAVTVKTLGHSYKNGVCARCGALAGFNDVFEKDWFAKDVKYVVDKKLMNGTGDDMFSPGGTTTRGQAVTILYRLAGSPSVSGDGFSDVKSSDWFYKAVQWASKNGIASGYGNGKFGPNDTLNREQLATMLYRYAQFKKLNTSSAGGLSQFSDSGSVSGYALDAMSWAVSKGLISGTSDGKLAPGSTATRAQLAAILHRFCENVK